MPLFAHFMAVQCSVTQYCKTVSAGAPEAFGPCARQCDSFLKKRKRLRPPVQVDIVLGCSSSVFGLRFEHTRASRNARDRLNRLLYVPIQEPI